MRFCSNCGSKINSDVAFCPNCGLKKGELKIDTPFKKQKTYKKDNSKRILLTLLILFWPAGLIYYFVKRSTIKEVHENNWFLNNPFLSWLIVFLCIGLVMNITSDDNSNNLTTQSKTINDEKTVQNVYVDENLAREDIINNPSIENTQTQIIDKNIDSESIIKNENLVDDDTANTEIESIIQNTNTETIIQKEYISISLDDLIFDFVSQYSELTDLQKEENFKDYDNKYIQDSALVKDIDTVFLSDSIVVRTINPENEYLTGATIYFESSEKEKLLSLNKYDEIIFEGIIQDYNGFLGIVIKDAIVKE